MKQLLFLTLLAGMAITGKAQNIAGPVGFIDSVLLRKTGDSGRSLITLSTLPHIDTKPIIDTMPVYFMVSNKNGGDNDFMFMVKGWMVTKMTPSQWGWGYYFTETASCLKADKRTPMDDDLLIWDNRPRKVEAETKGGKK